MLKSTQTAKQLMAYGQAAVLFMLAASGAGCGDSTPVAPTAPPTQTQAAAPVLAVFTDPVSGFTTSDVRDVQDQVVQFDTASGALIWAASGQRFSGYSVSGNLIRSGAFQVRFGTKNGERRAYFTETGPETICDIEVIGILLMITPTTLKVPQT